MTPSRETIMQALFTLLSNAAPFVTKGRRLKLWTSLNAADAPALFFAEHSEQYERASSAVPTKATINVDVFVYTFAGDDPNVVPATAMNTLLDAIDGALSPDPFTGLQTLGGLVTHCWISGKILKDPGDLDGKGVAIIPIQILLPVT